MQFINYHPHEPFAADRILDICDQSRCAKLEPNIPIIRTVLQHCTGNRITTVICLFVCVYLVFTIYNMSLSQIPVTFPVQIYQKIKLFFLIPNTPFLGQILVLNLYLMKKLTKKSRFS